MLHKVFNIYSDDLEDVQLFIEAGKNHIACWCKKTGDDVLRAFEFFRCNDCSSENLEEIVDNARLYSKLLTMPIAGTNFFWNTHEVLCLPPGSNDPDFLKANFELLFGNSPNAKIFSAPTELCTVAWRVEDEQQHIAQDCFRGAMFTHQYTSLLKSFQSGQSNNFYLLFYPNYCTLIVFKDGQLQFAQTRKYNAPEDVLYFILNVCKQYNIEKNVAIFCGGFIDEKSRLYEILYQYLEGFQLMHVDDNVFPNEAFKDYLPHHYIPYINYVV